MRPGRVLHVLSSASGGAAMSTIALIRGLKQRGIESAAVCHAVGDASEREAVQDATGGRAVFTVLYAWNRKFRTPWPERPIKEWKQGLRTGWARRSARVVSGEAVRFRADVIHTNTILNPEGGIAAAALGLPHAWHLRELLGPGRWFRLPVEGPALGPLLQRRCSMLVANSEVAAAAVRRDVPAGLLAVVPNGIDLQAFSTAGDRRRGGPLVVAMVANLASHVKNHALFVDAAALVRAPTPIEFRIYGAVPAVESPYVRGLRDRIDARGLGDRLRFMGFVERPEHIMRDIDLLVHPSDLESFGRIAVEAMAASRPVVGVRGGGIAEIVDDGVTGLLAAPHDAAGLAAHIAALAGDEATRRAMGVAGRRRAESLYSIDAHVERMMRVYAACLERPLGRIPRA